MPSDRVLVGGLPAESRDYFALIGTWLPIVIAFVLALTFVLLTLAFRSDRRLIDGDRGQSALGWRRVRAVGARLPRGSWRGPLRLRAGRPDRGVGARVPVLRAVRALDGLPGFPAESDPGALHEHARHNRGIIFGVGSTGRLITGAALIIIVVFIGFAAGELVAFQQMGFGVAVALLIDATIVRLVVIPGGNGTSRGAKLVSPRLARMAPAR